MAVLVDTAYLYSNNGKTFASKIFCRTKLLDEGTSITRGIDVLAVFYQALGKIID